VIPRWALALGVAVVASGAASPRRHDVHVTHTRLVLDGVHVVARIRWFRDDLERALGRPLGATPESRAALTAYLADHFRVRADGSPLTCRIEDDAADQDPNGEPVWWAIIQCDAARDIARLGLTNTLLFEQFRDQQNLVTVINAPDDQRRALYFQVGDRGEQVVAF
jgi:hypothetical protein